MTYMIAYSCIAAASVFVLMVAKSKVDRSSLYPDFDDYIGCIVGGILWPFCLLPCLAYFGAMYYIKNQKEKRRWKG